MRLFVRFNIPSFVVLLASLLGVFALPLQAEIYVIKNKDGSITFTSRTPAAGEKAELFKPQPLAFSGYALRSSSRRLNRLYKSEFSEIIHAAASKTAIDQDLIRAVIHAESAFDPFARSPKGAMGLMQLMPGTARLLGVRNPFEPRQNIHGGSAYLKSMLDRYAGDVRRALAAYNAGPLNVDTYRGIPPFRETRDYVQKVLALQRAYRAARQNS